MTEAGTGAFESSPEAGEAARMGTRRLRQPRGGREDLARSAGRPRKKVVLLQPIHQRGVDLLTPHFDVVLVRGTAGAVDGGAAGALGGGAWAEALAVEVSDASAIIVRTAPLPAHVIDSAPRLEVIARHGVGVDNIDVEAASRRGIPVVNTPHANTVSVAEHTLAMMLALAKRLVGSDQAVRSGRWAVRESLLAVDLEGKTLGVVGTGRIGLLVARKAHHAFGMDVLGFDPLVPAEVMEREAGAHKCETLEELLSRADFVTLHVPLTPATRGLMGAEALRLMKPGSFLINVARGEVVDEAALAEALRSGHIAAAALDVLGGEPPRRDNPLLGVDNVLLTPHMAALTRECAVRMAVGAAEQVRDVLLGGCATHVVNADALRRAGNRSPTA